jgi:drug/metabolite transporter (DMT)-like permease
MNVDQRNPQGRVHRKHHLPGLSIAGRRLLLNVYALGILGVAVSSIFINFIPVVPVIAGFFLLGERLMPL